MSREWYHWPGGVKTAWDSGEPSPDSVLRADFLNQFVEWGNYLSACGGDDPFYGWPARRTAAIVQLSTGIQYAEFWRTMQFFPNYDNWLNCGDANIGNDLTDWAAPLSGLPSAHNVIVGEDIHPRIAGGSKLQTFLENVRARMDACQTWKITPTWTPYSMLQEWRKDISTGTETYLGAGSASPNNYLTAYSGGVPNNPSTLHYVNYYFASLSVSNSVPCGIGVYLLDTTPSGEPRITAPFPNPGTATGASAVAYNSADCSGGWQVLSADYGKASSPYFFGTWAEYGYCNSGLMAIGRVLDSVPAAYKV